MAGLRGAIVNLAALVIAMAAITIACRVRRLPLRETLALRWPTLRQGLFWLGAFLVFAVLEEIISRRFGLGKVSRWSYSPLVILLRVLGILCFAPVVEELIFRGLLFDRLLHSRLGAAAAVMLPALLFATLHVQYGLLDRTFVLADGLFFGLARYRSGSLFLTILLHILGNAYAVSQRL